MDDQPWGVRLRTEYTEGVVLVYEYLYIMNEVFMVKSLSSGCPVLVQDLLDVSGMLALVFQIPAEHLARRPQLARLVRYHGASLGFAQPG